MKRMCQSKIGRMVAFLGFISLPAVVVANEGTSTNSSEVVGASNQVASISISNAIASASVSNQVASIEIPTIEQPRMIEPPKIEQPTIEPKIEQPRIEIPKVESTGDEDRSTHSLRTLELRALKAQALEELVVAMQQRLDGMAAKVRESELKVELLENRIKLQEAQRLKLVKDLEERSVEIKHRDQLLKLFRSGDFEYYQVQTGDTVVSIAANPMVYGNAERAPWIAQVNSLTPETPLVPGAILVIPRYTEGVSYEF